MRDVIRGIMGGLLTAVLFFGPAAPLYAAAGNVGSRGAEGADAIIHLWADQGDDAVDKWTIEVEASGDDFTINAGSTEVLNIDTNGTVTIPLGTIAITDSMTVGDTLTVSGQYAVVGPNAGTNYLVQSGTSTNGATVTFEIAFSSATVPVVSAWYTDTLASGASNATVWGASEVSNQFVVATGQAAPVGAPATNVSWFAIGVRP